jgi:hypothetical protein
MHLSKTFKHSLSFLQDPFSEMHTIHSDYNLRFQKFRHVHYPCLVVSLTRLILRNIETYQAQILVVAIVHLSYIL